MLRSPILLFTIVLVMSPIGASASVLNGVVSVFGCVAAGWIADRVGHWWAYFDSGTVMALVTIVMAAAPRTPTAYSSGMLAYAFLAALLTLPFQQWFCLRLDAVPRRLELHERRKS